MGILDVADKFRVQPFAAESFSDASPGYASRIGWTTLGNLPMAPSMGAQRWATYRSVYITNPWVYASVNMLARGIARLPLHVFQVDAQGRPYRIRGDVPSSAGRPSGPQSLDRMLANGFNGLSRNAMFGGTMIDRLVYGNATWWIQRDTFGSPNGFKRIRWRDMLRVVPDQDGTPIAYEWRPWNGYQYGPIQHVMARDVIHFGQGSDPEGLYGLSPLESCRHTLALHDALVRHLVGFFSNSARPSGFVSIDKDINKARAEEIRQALRDLYTSPENAGKVIAAAGATWQEMGKAPDQSAIVELVKLSREEIAAAYSVPPPVLGILDQAIKPLDPSTEIRMADGTLKRLDAIVPGDYVITHTGAEGRVAKNLDAGVQSRLRLTTTDGRVVIGAPDHPFLTTRGWMMLSELGAGDKLIREPVIEAARDEITAEEARLLGYFVGDGATGASGTTHNATFTNADPLTVADFTAAAERQGWRVTKVSQYGYCVAAGVRPWLKAHGLAFKTSHTKRVPDAVLRGSNEIVAEFLRAYFMCDGCAFYREEGSKRVYMATVSRGLAEDVQHLLGRLGIHSRIRRQADIAWNVNVAASGFARFEETVAPFGYKGDALALIVASQPSRDLVPVGGGGCAVEECGDVLLARGLCSRHYAYARRHDGEPEGVSSRDAYDRVLSVETLAPGPVRCLAIDHDDHSYMAHGVVTHNSNVKELREQFGRDSLGPWASDFEGEFAAQLLPQQPSWAGLQVRFDLAELLRPDLEALALVAQRMAPMMTVDEIRTRWLGLEPLDLEGLTDSPWAARGTAPLTTFVPVEPGPNAATEEADDTPADPGVDDAGTDAA